MIKTMRRIVLCAIALILAAGIACGAVVTCGSETPLAGMRADLIDTLLDQTGIKQRVQGALEDKAREVAEQTGIPYALFEQGIDALAVQDWQAAELPEGTEESASFDFDYEGQNVHLTTYDDARYVSLSAYGQQITFEVPESTQAFTSAAPLIAQGQQGVDLISSLLGA